jgi:sugar/nucleoside kinase (ribokinase family)/kynurenine formamidase
MSDRGGGRVVTLGAHIIDTLGRPVTEIPPGQGRRLLEQIRITAAGTAAGTSVDLAKLGVEVVAVGAIGDDTLGDFLLSELRRHGVHTGGLVRKSRVQTGSSILPIRPNGERPALVVRGANAELRAADVDRDLLRRASVVHIGAPDVLAAITPDELAELAGIARAGGATVTMDVLTSGEDDGLARIAPALAHVRCFMPNEEQLRSFTGEVDLHAAATRVLALGVETIVVSRGADGATVITADRVTHLPAYPVQVVDTTGCGDAVSAGVITGLVHGWPIEDGARLGLAAASLVASGLGSDFGIRDLPSTAQIVVDAGPADVASRFSDALRDLVSSAGAVRDPPSFDELPGEPGECPSAWTTFGEADRLGLINLQTSARIAAAAALVRSGRMFSLNAPIDAIDPPMHGRQQHRHTLMCEEGGVSFDDYLDNFYPQAASQWDALSHMAWRAGTFFGGATAEDVQARRGATIDAWAERGIAGRGVLLDLDAVLGGAGVGFDPAATVAITVEQLEAARERAGVSWRPGDIMLLHTGFLEWYLSQDPTVRAAVAIEPFPSVGLAHGEEMVRYLWDSHVSAIAADNPAVEAWPPAAGAFGSLHRCLIGRFGMALGELLVLSELAAACRAQSRYDVFFTAAPLNVPGGVGSTANALAFM